MNDTLNAALALHSAGISVIPLGENKVPLISWREFCDRQPTRAEIEAWFARPAGLARVCGAISGNLETIDFDVDGEIEPSLGITADSLCREWGAIVEEARPGLLSRLTVIATPRPGWHVSYRCAEPVGGNRKLADVPKREPGKWKTVIETRGDGGYALCPGSPAWAHPTGRLYQHVAGPSLAEVATITAEERATLLQAARQLNRRPVEEPKPETRTARRQIAPGCGVKPGEHFEAEATWADILEPLEWKCTAVAGETEYWQRPGGSHKWSASANHNGSGLLYPFSPNCGFPDMERGYSKFATFVYLHCNGDFEEATRELSSRGYGRPAEVDVDISAILGEVKKRTEPEREPWPEALKAPPGFLASLVDYNLSTAFIPQPVLALAAGLSLMGTLIGRKVTDSIGSRANIYAIGICRSGGGKERARQINKHLLYLAGGEKLIGPEGIASAPGLVNAVANSPSILFQVDEIGRFLKTTTSPKASHLYAAITALMKLYTSSGTIYKTDAYADREKSTSIAFPNANLYGTTVPESLFASFTQENLTDGFASRLLIFEGDPESRPDSRPDSIEPPEGLVEFVRHWLEFSPGGNLSDINPDPLRIEYTEPAERLMWDFSTASLERQPDPIAQAMWSRAHEKARKLALIYACSEDREAPRVDTSAAEWAIGVVEFLTRRALALAAEHMVENETESAAKRLENVIAEAGSISGNSLYKKTRFLKAHEREGILKSLEDCGRIARTSERSGRGRPKVTIYWLGDDDE